MLHRLRMVVLTATWMGVVVGTAAAQITDPGKDEAKCQKSAGSALVKFVGAKTKCVQKCLGTARKTSGPYAGCFGPGFTDPATNACVFDAKKGAEAKARASIVKACADAPGKDRCPECFAPSVCTTGEPVVSDTEAQIDPLGAVVFCTEGAGGTPTKDEAKCEDSVAKALTKFVGSKSKCYQKCNDNLLKGKVPPGSCDPPVPSDPATATCVFDPVKGAEAKAAASIDKACAEKSANPACYGTALDTGAEWVALVEPQVDANIPVTACGSPSGAFLD